MNEVTIFNNSEFGEIRTLETNDGKVMFCGVDVAKALGYSNSRKALADHCKGVTKCDTPTKVWRCRINNRAYRNARGREVIKMTKAKAIEVLNIGYDGCVKFRETLRGNSDDDADYLNDLLIALLTAIDALKQSSSVEAEPMGEYISKDDAVGAGYLSDWYISSVGDESPVWTDEHIDELLNDFLVIPKEAPARPTRK